MILLQISDLHIATPDTEFEQGYQTAEKLKVAVEAIKRFAPEPVAIFATGDLVNSGQMEEYKILKNLLEDLPCPCYLGVGNHDNRETLIECFKDTDYLPKEGFIQYAVEFDGLRGLMLDTNIPKEPGGILCDARLEWLDKMLTDKPDIPTILFMHHPPFETGMGMMDSMGLKDKHKFEKIVRKHDQIIRLCCGHLHRPITGTFGGKTAQVCPSTSHRVLLCLQEKHRLGTTAEPPEIMVHRWVNNKLVTHSIFTEDYPILWELPEGEKLY
ncbi:MAG: phosphodiesterase [Sneathiellales bacterium]|nr:phosphodiesterase [Sneathiellales bacterium]